MPTGFSTYLDLLRLGAALAVFVGHWGITRFTGGAWAGLEAHAHSAVIVFFVLSGYLITAVAVEREADIRRFAASRAARIYSVALPALAITVAVDQILVAHSHDQLYPYYQYAAPEKYLPLFLGFATEFWLIHEDAFSNLPYWSLGYEVWFYVLFGAFHYLRGRRRWLVVGGVLLLVGPRLWLLLPVWAAGSLAYHAHRRACGRPAARRLFAATLAALLAIKLSGLDLFLNQATAELAGPALTVALRYSRFVVADLLIGVLLALHLWAARRADLDFGPLRRPIVAAAGVTFTLYLVHYPLLELFAWQLALPPAALLVAVPAGCAALALVTERQKTPLRRLFERALGRPRRPVVGGVAAALRRGGDPA